jgi:hypothetical protein
MDRVRIHEGVRRMRFEDVLGRTSDLWRGLAQFDSL